MKATYKLVILCIAINALVVTTTAQTTWKLSENLLATNNQISFNQGSNGVWYFLQSSSFQHDPKTYKFLPAYDEPCPLNALSLLINGLACWRNPIPSADGNKLPIVGVNSTCATQFPLGWGIPPRSVLIHPGVNGLGLIGWKSPISGLVNVAGFFSDLDPQCGNGVIWSVDKGSQTLASGTIANGGPFQSFSLVGVPVVAGQVLYFTVDPNSGDYSCDTTGVDVTITKPKSL